MLVPFWRTFPLYSQVLIHLQEEDDVNYEEEAEVADEFDSDFDEDVSISWLSYDLHFVNLK